MMEAGERQKRGVRGQGKEGIKAKGSRIKDIGRRQNDEEKWINDEGRSS